MPSIILVLHNIRSCHNVGSLLRSADGFGVKTVYFSGITPYPKIHDDPRLPHLKSKISKQISKTALGAEKTLEILVFEDLSEVTKKLKSEGFTIAAIEQSTTSVRLPDFSPPDKLALVLGNEIDGLPKQEIELCDVCLEIPMHGNKESFNVSVAGAVALYQITTPRH